MDLYVSALPRFEGRRRFRTVCAAMVAAALLCGASLASAAIDKNALYQEMLGLAQQMNGLKPQMRTNSQAASAFATAESRYRAISASMGGDDPGHVLRGSSAALRANKARRVRVTKPTKGLAPGGCAAASNTYSNNTPVAIDLANPSVVTSTINVSGAGTYLYHLSLTTFIQHTFAADLDVTIQSPAGTVVTLTTDNGGSNDDVFNGTVWDDNADPGGQVPYTADEGLVTDHTYTNLTLASPLVPEEALGAFIGENPNGTWTITISDDLAGDGGSLNSWSMDITTIPPPTIATVPTVSNTTPVAIPLGPGVVTSTIVVSGAGTSILDVKATTFIQHTFSADLDVTITSPAGTVVTLTTDNGAGNDDVFNGTVWDDKADPGGQVPYTADEGLVTDHTYANLTLASPLVPEEAMSAFEGEDPNGTWTITISDDLAGDGGNLNSWSLDIRTLNCAVAASPADLSLTKTLTTPGPIHVGDNVTFHLTVTDNGPGAATGVIVDDPILPHLTYVSNSCGATFSSPPAIHWNVGNLANGASASCDLTATVNQAGSIVNVATVTGNESDPTPGNNISTAAGSTVTDVPTLDTLGLAALAILLAVSAAFALRRKRQA